MDMQGAKTMKHFQWMSLILILVLVSFQTMSAQTFASDYGHSSILAVDIISDERGVLNKYTAGPRGQSTRRSYVIAHDGDRYSVRVRNRSSERIGIVIAVDGRNIISGKKSHLKPQERMYILGPYQSAEYEGWRTSKNRVNRFYFTGMSDSYSAAWGDHSAIGVIAVAAYKSRHQDLYSHKGKGQHTNPLKQPRTNKRQENPGTGLGESEWSPSRTVRFSPQHKPFAREFIKYEWKSTLCRKGVINCRRPQEHYSGNRFWPDHPRDHGFAPFPPFWPFR